MVPAEWSGRRHLSQTLQDTRASWDVTYIQPLEKLSSQLPLHNAGHTAAPCSHLLIYAVVERL